MTKYMYTPNGEAVVFHACHIDHCKYKEKLITTDIQWDPYIVDDSSTLYNMFKTTKIERTLPIPCSNWYPVVVTDTNIIMLTPESTTIVLFKLTSCMAILCFKNCLRVSVYD